MTRAFTGPLAAALILAAFWCLMLASLRHKSLTTDEIAHATAGYTYWRFGDYRLDPENGNLPQRVMALPLLRGFRFPPTASAAWRQSDEWAVGDQWFHAMGNDVAAMLFRGRAASAAMAVALGALVWACSRRLFGPAGGFLSLLLYVLSPTILANGALMTSDTACGLFFLASTLSLWAMLHRLTWGRLLLSGLMTGALFVSKMSAVLIVPIGLLLIAARLLDGRPLPVRLFGRPRELTGRWRQAAAFAAAGAAHALLVLLIIWASFGFRYSAFADGGSAQEHLSDTWPDLTDQPLMPAVLADLRLTPAQHEAVMRRLIASAVPFNRWTPEALAFMRTLPGTVLTPAQSRRLDADLAAPPHSLADRLLLALDRRRLLPQAYAFGCAFSLKFSRQRGAFLNGKFSLSGWWYFFPYTALVKTPLPVFGIVLLAMVATALRWRSENRLHGVPLRRQALRSLYATLPLWALLLVYWSVVLRSHLNIGHRHILATYPPLFILCGAAARLPGEPERAGGARRLLGGAVLALLALLAAEVAYRFPNYIAYFNAIAGGPAHAYRHLVDSSLDWGQDLPGLKRYLDEHAGSGRAYLSYFGSASPAYYDIRAQPLYSSGKPMDLETFPVAESGRRTRDWLREHPDFHVAAAGSNGTDEAVMFLEDPRAFRLAGGLYCISATMLQPLEYDRSGPWGPWNSDYEARYQRLAAEARPFLQDDPAARVAALRRGSVYAWMRVLNTFDEFRFARLTAYLRQREPDDSIGYSILVYRLSDADVARAVAGPPPELGPNVLRDLQQTSGQLPP